MRTQKPRAGKGTTLAANDSHRNRWWQAYFYSGSSFDVHCDIGNEGGGEDGICVHTDF